MRYRKTHVIDLPKRIVVGSGVRKEISKHFKSLGLESPITIVTGSGPTQSIGREVREHLEDSRFDVFQLEVRLANIDSVSKVEEVARESRCKVIVGLGGGKAIDVAKYVAYRMDVDFISVPTSASHDGLVSPFASLKGMNTIYSMKAKAPLMVLADTELIAKAPRRFLIAGCGDLIGKFTAVLDWQLAHKLRGEYYGQYAASLALLSAKHIISLSNIIAKGGEEAARIVVEGLISSGVAMCIAGSTRPASGSEHLFSHALDLVANFPALHGEQVGVGTIMMAYLHGRNWSMIRRVLKKLGAPTTARELGVSNEKVIEALTIAHKIRPERYTILGEKGLTRKAAEKLAKTTGVIEEEL
ncbi:MAG: NAD(P)-dependent glycerol-1-phosphate dehydrogenase [Thermoprotei archaeon]|nr:MAG: NAD(P)-dependent glycerol-1-phosphate dehydrogenase [Thermoprotei archaeon]